MVAVARKTSKVALLRSALNPLLEEHGATIGEDGGMYLEERSSLPDILACLIRVTRDHTVILNFALGKCWACMGGKRTETLRQIVGVTACEAMQRRLMNYASIYRRWIIPQGSHTWTWHRDHGMDKHGMVVRHVPTAAAKALVCELAVKLRHSDTSAVKEELWWAVDALEHMSDDDEDTFACETEED